jgi:hypothetical protein
MRGHVRRDPQLGTLIRDVEAEDWEGDFRVQDRTVEILIDGKEGAQSGSRRPRSRAGGGFR